MNELPLSPPATVTEKDRVSILTCMLLAALDQTIVAPAIPAMGAALGGSDYITWIVSAYFLTSTATAYGKIADIRGRRPTLYTALAIFVAGSVMCALAPQMWVLILGRAVQGIGGGGLMALAQIVISDLVPPKERGRYAVLISGTWAIASIAGPIVGGVLTERLSWTVIFWLNIPLALVAAVMTWATLKRVPWERRAHKLDVLGSVLVVTATASLMLALACGPQVRFGWNSPVVLALFAGAALLTPLITWHLIRAREPLIPVEVLRNSVVLTATFSVFFSMASSIGLTVIVPLYFELALHMTASQAGLGLLGYTVGSVIGALYAGRAMVYVEDYKLLPIIGLSVTATGLAWLALRANLVGFIEAEIVLILIGMGLGPQFPTTTVAVQNAVEPHNVGIAIGVSTFLRALGAAVGVAVIGAVAAAAGISVSEGLHASPANLQGLTGEAFRPVFLAISVIVSLGLILLAIMPVKPLRRTNAQQGVSSTQH